MSEEKLALSPAGGRIRAALARENFEEAQALLETCPRLTWLDVSACAPRVLGKSPKLLERILDLGPKREVYCYHDFTRPSDGADLYLCASLLTAAAALDDLEAVELLLARGYSTRPASAGSYSSNGENSAVAAWYYLVATSHKGTSVVGWFDLVPPGWEIPPKNGCCCGLIDSDPLSAAVWCGATRCALRLLPETAAELSNASRLAIAGLEDAPPDPFRDQTVREVCAALGLKHEKEAEDPKRLLEDNEPLFRELFPDHPEWATFEVAKLALQIGETLDWDDSLWDLFSRETLSKAATWLFVHKEYQFIGKHLKSNLELELLCEKLGLTVSRCDVPAAVDRGTVCVLLDHLKVVGEVRKGCVSGLAAALFCALAREVKEDRNLGRRSTHRLLYHEQLRTVLDGEEPGPAAACLEWAMKENGMDHKSAWELFTLLGFQKEDDYEL